MFGRAEAGAGAVWQVLGLFGRCWGCLAGSGVARSGSGVPGPGLEMQYAILLISFVSSFASLGKVFLREEKNVDGWRPRICRYTSYNQWYLKPQR